MMPLHAAQHAHWQTELCAGVVVFKALVALAAGSDDEGEPIFVNTVLWKFDIHTFAAMPIVIFAYHCHIQAVPIYFELHDNPLLVPCLKRRTAIVRNGDNGGSESSHEPVSRMGHRAGIHPADVAALPAAQEPDNTVDIIARKLRGMYNVLAAAYAECTLLYLATGIAGYLLFPRTAASNILNNFAKEDMFMQGVRFFVGWAVVLHYPINQHVARSALYDLICRCASAFVSKMRRGCMSAHLGMMCLLLHAALGALYSCIPMPAKGRLHRQVMSMFPTICGLRRRLGFEPRQEDVPYQHVAAITLGFFVAVTTTACIVTDLGIVFQLIGGIAGSLLIFILPGALIVADHRKVAVDSYGASSSRSHRDSNRNGESSRSASRSDARHQQPDDAHAPILHGSVGERNGHGRSRSRGSNGRSNGAAPRMVRGAHSAHSQALLDAKPCYESRWDSVTLGWTLIVLGILVAVLTVCTAFAQYTMPEAEDSHLHAGFSTNSTLVEGSGSRRLHM